MSCVSLFTTNKKTNKSFYCNWIIKINLSFLQKIIGSLYFITNSVVHSYSSMYAAGKLKTNEDIIGIKYVYYASQLFRLHLNLVQIPSKVHLMGRERCEYGISAKRTLPIRKRRLRNVNLGIWSCLPIPCFSIKKLYM